MTYGVFQEYYVENWTLKGSSSTTGIIGTTQNGVSECLFICFL
jgi:hypothetical protein